MVDTPTVAVIGGGYAGIRVATGLDDVAQVVLVDPKDSFHHNVAALRGLVDPTFLTRTFMSYASLLRHGRVIRDRAVAVDGEGITLAAGERLTPDYTVLATGSSYPFPAKSSHVDSEHAKADYEALRTNLAQAEKVLILGAGAVGLELAGEIAAMWPDKRITLIDPAEEILPGPYSADIRADLSRQLDELGVVRLLGTRLAALPETDPGDLKSITVTTTNGSTVEADLWLRAFGIAPLTEYLAGDLVAARTSDGYLSVTDELTVVGHPRLYALGDIAGIDDNKAGVARRQAEVVIANISADISGSGERRRYETTPPGILLPLGPTHGAGEWPGRGLLDAATVVQMKGADMLTTAYEELFKR